MGAGPWLTWFCVWQAESVVDPAESDVTAVAGLLEGCPGLRVAQLMTPVGASDPYYPTNSGSPSLIAQLHFDDLLLLEAALAIDGYLAPLADPAFLPSLDRTAPCQQAMLARHYPVTDPTGRGETRLSYWVEYEGPAEDPTAWHVHYNRNHPSLMARLPGIRAIEIYTPAVVVCGLGLPERPCLQRNKTVFDSPEAMKAAMLGPVREALRAEFRSLPRFEGASHHFPFLTRTVRPAAGAT